MKSVKNFRYVEKTSAECNEDSYLAILHLSRVELHCKLQEKLHLVTWPLGCNNRLYFCIPVNITLDLYMINCIICFKFSLLIVLILERLSHTILV